AGRRKPPVISGIDTSRRDSGGSARDLPAGVGRPLPLRGVCLSFETGGWRHPAILQSPSGTTWLWRLLPRGVCLPVGTGAGAARLFSRVPPGLLGYNGSCPVEGTL